MPPAKKPGFVMTLMIALFSPSCKQKAFYEYS
jgi:hypothetical protein